MDSNGYPIHFKRFAVDKDDKNLVMLRVLKAPRWAAAVDESLVYDLGYDFENADPGSSEAAGLKQENAILDKGHFVHIPKGHYVNVINNSKKETATIQVIMYVKSLLGGD